MRTFIDGPKGYGYQGASSRWVVQLDDKNNVVTAFHSSGWKHPPVENISGQVNMSGYKKGEVIPSLLFGYLTSKEPGSWVEDITDPSQRDLSITLTMREWSLVRTALDCAIFEAGQKNLPVQTCYTQILQKVDRTIDHTSPK